MANQHMVIACNDFELSCIMHKVSYQLHTRDRYGSPWLLYIKKTLIYNLGLFNYCINEEVCNAEKNLKSIICLVKQRALD